MGFTLSHPAAVLPFVRTPLLPAGLAIGSMVPDLPYFVPIGLTPEYTHSPIGALTANLPLGIACFVLWVFLLRSPLLDFAPSWLRGRFVVAGLDRSRVAAAALLVGSLLVGIATHLLWDSFTHPDGWMAMNIAFLQAQLGPFPLYRWGQYISSVAGLIIIAVWVARWVARTEKPSAVYRRTTREIRLTAWCVVAGILVLTASATWIGGLLRGLFPVDRKLVYDTAVFSIALSGLVGLLFCLGWYLVPERPKSSTPSLPTAS